MPMNVLGNSLNNSEKNCYKSIFYENNYLRANYLESNIEEYLDMKNQFEIKSLKDPPSIGDAASKNYVHTLFNDPSMIKNTARVDFNDKNLDNVIIVKVN